MRTTASAEPEQEQAADHEHDPTSWFATSRSLKTITDSATAISGKTALEASTIELSPRSEPTENVTTPRMSAAPARSATHRPKPGRRRDSSLAEHDDERNEERDLGDPGAPEPRDPSGPVHDPAQQEAGDTEPDGGRHRPGQTGEVVGDPVPELAEIRGDERHAGHRDPRADHARRPSGVHRGSRSRGDAHHGVPAPIGETTATGPSSSAL